MNNFTSDMYKKQLNKEPSNDDFDLVTFLRMLPKKDIFTILCCTVKAHESLCCDENPEITALYEEAKDVVKGVLNEE